MNRFPFDLLLVGGVLTSGCKLHAQYTLDSSVVGGGGGVVSGGDYVLDGTVSGPDASSSGGGDYVLAGGFWPGVVDAPANPPTLAIGRSGNDVILSWTGAGFVVQGTGELTGSGAPSSWADLSAGNSADGAHFAAIVVTGGRMKFFRLRAQ